MEEYIQLIDGKEEDVFSIISSRFEDVEIQNHLTNEKLVVRKDRLVPAGALVKAREEKEWVCFICMHWIIAT